MFTQMYYICMYVHIYIHISFYLCSLIVNSSLITIHLTWLLTWKLLWILSPCVGFSLTLCLGPIAHSHTHTQTQILCTCILSYEYISELLLQLDYLIVFVPHSERVSIIYNMMLFAVYNDCDFNAFKYIYKLTCMYTYELRCMCIVH